VCPSIESVIALGMYVKQRACREQYPLRRSSERQRSKGGSENRTEKDRRLDEAAEDREESHLVECCGAFIFEDLGCTVQSIGVLGRCLKPNLDDI
jgi:hypothetical protein